MLSSFFALFLMAAALSSPFSSKAQVSYMPKEEWCVQKINDQSDNLAFITANMGYRSYPYKDKFPWSLAVNITTIEQNQNGHPTDKEATMLNLTQDIITEAFKQAGTVHFVGRVTVKGYRELYYYVADPEKANAILTKLTKKRQPRIWEYQMQEDSQWQRVAVFFRPGAKCL